MQAVSVLGLEPVDDVPQIGDFLLVPGDREEAGALAAPAKVAAFRFSDRDRESSEETNKRKESRDRRADSCLTSCRCQSWSLCAKTPWTMTQIGRPLVTALGSARWSTPTRCESP